MSPIFLKKNNNIKIEAVKKNTVLNLLELNLPLITYSDFFSQEFSKIINDTFILSKILEKDSVSLELLLDSILLSLSNQKYLQIEKIKKDKLFINKNILEKFNSTKKLIFSEIKMSEEIIEIFNFIFKDIFLRYKICIITPEFFLIYCLLKKKNVLNKIYNYNFNEILGEYNNFTQNIHKYNLNFNNTPTMGYFSYLLLKYLPSRKITKLCKDQVLYFRHLLISKVINDINIKLLKNDFYYYFINNLNILRKYNYKF